MNRVELRIHPSFVPVRKRARKSLLRKHEMQGPAYDGVVQRVPYKSVSVSLTVGKQRRSGRSDEGDPRVVPFRDEQRCSKEPSPKFKDPRPRGGPAVGGPEGLPRLRMRGPIKKGGPERERALPFSALCTRGPLRSGPLGDRGSDSDGTEASLFPQQMPQFFFLFMCFDEVFIRA